MHKYSVQAGWLCHRSEEKYHGAFAGSSLLTSSHQVTLRTNKPYKTYYVSKPPTLGLLDASVLKERSFFGSYSPYLCSLSLRSPTALLPSITAVKMTPLSSEDLSSGVIEHPCNYLCFKKGQILTGHRAGFITFSWKGESQKCVCSMYIPLAWINCEEAAGQESLFTR